jgi:mRNA-degrading endonuclease toxin of MazEF toxin-antitoxin module
MTEPPPVATPVYRGEIWWVDPVQSGEFRKARPAIVVTADGLSRARRTVVVVPLSTGPQPRAGRWSWLHPLPEQGRSPFAIRFAPSTSAG